VKNLGGLFVLGTERHEARRIDNQLRGRSGRQGDPGTTQFFVSLEDDLMRVFGSDRIKSMMGRFGIPEDEPIINSMVSRALENAQSKIEGLNFDMRKHLLEYDDVTSHQRDTIYERRNDIVLGGKESVDNFIERALISLPLSEEEKADFTTKIKARREALGEDNFVLNARRLILQVIDLHWVEHLEAIEYMRGSVRLRAYGQRDPLVEFKREGLALFKEMELAIFGRVLEYLSNLGQEVKEEKVQLEAVHGSVETITKPTTEASRQVSGPKVGRNDPCPCGSGKKYKKCCGS
ncbi:MAG TPA: SEC-C metal-binding domain-containing protein, partial [Candidatus Paceibacterota bacterium]|nr:SEC-C metal-binding domain-containing protein [Candidatus Paceibacterota bacterium]